MDAFQLFYAVGSLIAAGLVAAVIYLWLPARELMERNRFEKIFGFRPPKGERGPGSRPISWDRREKVHSYLREDAFRADRTLHNMHADLEALTDNEENSLAAVKVTKLFWNLAAQLFVSYRAFYRHWRRFNRAHGLAVRFGFTSRACDYAFYVYVSKIKREQVEPAVAQATRRSPNDVVAAIRTKLETVERENRTLRANASKSVLRRLEMQGAIVAQEE